MTTEHHRFGILTAPPDHVSTADDPADVARQLGARLVAVDQETRWTVIDLATGDQVGGTVDGSHGLPGLLTLLTDIAALLHNPLTPPRTSCDLWVGHLLPYEIRELGFRVPDRLVAVTLWDSGWT